MYIKPKHLLLLLHHHHAHRHTQTRPLTKVRLKWVKNRSLDHIIEKHTDLKAAHLLKDAILKSPSSSLPLRSLSPLQLSLGLTFPVLRFLRRYPTLFTQSPHPRYPSLPTFSLTPTALHLHSLESHIHSSHLQSSIQSLSKLLLMCRSKSLPLDSLHNLQFDLGLPHDFLKTLILPHPDLFRVIRAPNGTHAVKLISWDESLAVSEIQKRNTGFQRGRIGVGFPMTFPRGYGGMKKVKEWMEEFERLPYVSPYEDAKGIDPESEIMEKRVVGVLHEVLSLMVYRKTKRNYLRSLREELGLPHRFTRIFTRYPGIFYLSLKCKTTTVVLKEGYRRGRVVDPHPLVGVRDKFYHVMTTGMLYRGKGVEELAKEGWLVGADADAEQENDDEEEEEEEGEWEEGGSDPGSQSEEED